MTPWSMGCRMDIALCVCSVTQLCPTLCNPMDCSPPDSSVHEIFQARVLEWVAISCSRGSSWPRDQTNVYGVSFIVRCIFYPCSTWEAPGCCASKQEHNLKFIVHLHGTSWATRCEQPYFERNLFSWAVGLNSGLKIISKLCCKPMSWH